MTLLTCLAPLALTGQGFSAKRAGACIEMQVADHMSRTWDLNESAMLQFRDNKVPAFILVIEDDKGRLQDASMKFGGADDFLEYFVKDFKKDKADRVVEKPRDFQSNGFSHAQTEMYWTEDGMRFFMLVTAVETPGHYYKILCWTTNENKVAMKPEFLRTSASLRE